VAVPGDPLTDPTQFGRVHFVMKAGRIYKQEQQEQPGQREDAP
jgi:imidazolonepropionase-like amidohydrolase